MKQTHPTGFILFYFFLWDSLFLTFHLATVLWQRVIRFKSVFQQGTKDSQWTSFYYLLGGLPSIESERLKRYIRHVPAVFTSAYNPHLNLPGTILKTVIVYNYVQNKNGAERREEKYGLN